MMEIPEASISCYAVSASSLRCEATFLVPIPKERSAPGQRETSALDLGVAASTPEPDIAAAEKRALPYTSVSERSSPLPRRFKTLDQARYSPTDPPPSHRLLPSLPR